MASDIIVNGVLDKYATNLGNSKVVSGDGVINDDVDDNNNNNNSNNVIENLLKLDGDDDSIGDDKIIDKDNDDLTNSKTNNENNVDEEGDDGGDESNKLLETLATDIETYHKKVQLKKKKFETPIDSKISEEVQKEEDDLSSKKRVIDDKDDDGNDVAEAPKPKKNKAGRRPINRQVCEWTKSEDDAIVYYKEEMKYSWKKIEELLDQKHSWQAIQMRYLRNHKSRNEEWSRFMEIKLINAVRKDWENRWKRISNDLGKDFGIERCINKNIEICKKMELPYYNNVFNNKDITQGYENQFHDIKDSEAHKKLLLVYMGLDSITYEDSDDEAGDFKNDHKQQPQLDIQNENDNEEEVAAAAIASVEAQNKESQIAKEKK